MHALGQIYNKYLGSGNQEKLLHTFEEVDSELATLSRELESANAQAASLWQEPFKKPLQSDAFVKRIDGCRQFLQTAEEKLNQLDNEHEHAKLWKNLFAAKIKLLQIQNQNSQLAARLADPEYIKIAAFFQKAIARLNLQKDKGNAARLLEFQVVFPEIKEVLPTAQRAHAKALFVQGVRYIKAVHESMNNLSLDESQVVDGYKEGFIELLSIDPENVRKKVEDSGEYEEYVVRGMQTLSFEEPSSLLNDRFTERQAQVSLRGGRSFVGWNFLAGRQYPHIIEAITKAESCAKQLQCMESLLAEQIPQICSGDLLATSVEQTFYEQKLVAIQKELSELKGKLYLGDFPTEMLVGLKYVARLEVLLRQVTFAAQFFSYSSDHFAPVASMQMKFVRYLDSKEFSLLGPDNPLRTYVSVQRFFHATHAVKRLWAVSSTDSSFSDFGRWTIRTIQSYLSSRSKRVIALNQREKKVKEAILSGGVFAPTDPLRSLELKSLIQKMIVNSLLETSSDDKLSEELLIVSFFMSMKGSNYSLLQRLRESDAEFDQLLYMYGWTVSLTNCLNSFNRKVDPSQENMHINMILKTNYKDAQIEKEQKLKLLILLEEKTAFSNLIRAKVKQLLSV